jgi:hypothetical protein
MENYHFMDDIYYEIFTYIPIIDMITLSFSCRHFRLLFETYAQRQHVNIEEYIMPFPVENVSILEWCITQVRPIKKIDIIRGVREDRLEIILGNGTFLKGWSRATHSGKQN